MPVLGSIGSGIMMVAGLRAVARTAPQRGHEELRQFMWVTCCASAILVYFHHVQAMLVHAVLADRSSECKI